MYVILIADEKFNNWVAVGPRFGAGPDDLAAVRKEALNYPGSIIAYLP